MTDPSSMQVERSQETPSPSVEVVRYPKRTGAAAKRRHPRFLAALEIAFENFSEHAIERTVNVSKAGVFVNTMRLLPLQTKVLLNLTLPSGEHLTSAAEVVHLVTPEQASGQSYPAGLGLRFSHPSPDFRRQLSSFLATLERAPPHVLVVDDDEDFRAALADGLRSLGMTVDYAATGEEALRKLVDGFFQIDMVLLDIRMPGLDGRGFLDRVRRLGGEPNLPIIVLSAAPRADLQPLKGPHGANDVLTKSDTLEEIAARVKDVLSRNSLLEDQL